MDSILTKTVVTLNLIVIKAQTVNDFRPWQSGKSGKLKLLQFARFPKILERVVAVAFTDSVHSLNSDSRAEVRKWFLEVSAFSSSACFCRIDRKNLTNHYNENKV